MYNPKFKDFLKENPEVSVIGVYWAGLWRLNVIVYGIVFGLMLIVGW
jgi:hypothetical protein